MFGLGMQELVIVGIVAVLLFGKRLPEVARSLGKSYNEFRSGLGEIQSSVDYNNYSAPNYSNHSTPSSSSSSSSYDEFDDYDEPAAPKFAPPPAETAAAEAQTDEGEKDSVA